MFVAYYYKPYDEVAALTERIRARRRKWEDPDRFKRE